MQHVHSKGPFGWALGVVMAVGLMQVLRVLELPDSPLGIVASSFIQAAGVFVVARLCVVTVPARRFFLVAVPLMTAANFLWPPFRDGLSPERQQGGELVSAMVIGIGLGGILAIWWMDGRLRDRSRGPGRSV